MTRPTVHIIGAGLAGLSAAVALSTTSARIVVHESAGMAGGRCRSWFDRKLGLEIDNGNHLLLSGNSNALACVKSIGAEQKLAFLDEARFPFIDLRSARRWTLAPGNGPLPLWLLARERRAPDARLGEYMNVLKLIWRSGDVPLRERMDCHGPLFETTIRPLLLAALNSEPEEASSALAREVMRSSLMKGAQACKPIFARNGLSRALIDPALRLLERRNVEMRFGEGLRSIEFGDGHVRDLHFPDQNVRLKAQDIVILAVPASAAAMLAPGIMTPNAFNAIINLHFAIAPPQEMAPITALIGGHAEWLFAYDDRLSVTISAANRLLTKDPQDLAREIWREISCVAPFTCDLPPWRVVREKRATFAATPEQNRRRPATRTQWSNLLLAGDWTATGLPATIEGAVQSGFAAAQAAQDLMASSFAQEKAVR